MLLGELHCTECGGLWFATEPESGLRGDDQEGPGMCCPGRCVGALYSESAAFHLGPEQPRGCFQLRCVRAPRIHLVLSTNLPGQAKVTSREFVPVASHAPNIEWWVPGFCFSGGARCGG